MLGRLTLALLLVAVAGAGCGGEPVSRPPTETPLAATPKSAAPPSPTPVPSAPSPSRSPTLDTDVRLPARAPATFPRDVAAAHVAVERLAPEGARIATAWAAPAEAGTDAVAFAWTRGGDPFAAEAGFEVWARFAGDHPAWRAVYAFTDAPSSGVLGVRFETGDLTGDGLPDALTFEDLGGSGACGTWRVVAIAAGDAAEIYSRQTCDTDVRIVGGDLRLRAAVYEAGDAHCCPSAYRTTALRWTGTGWDVVERSTQPA